MCQILHLLVLIAIYEIFVVDTHASPLGRLKKGPIWGLKCRSTRHESSRSAAFMGFGISPLKGGGWGGNIVSGSGVGAKSHGTIAFEITCNHIANGEKVGMIGSVDELNNWKEPVIMNGERAPLWRLELPSMTSRAVDYKYVIINKSGDIQRWEKLRWNRLLQLEHRGNTPPSASLVVNDGDFFEEKETIVFEVTCSDTKVGQSVGITGSADFLNDWKKPVIMDGQQFPLWRVVLPAPRRDVDYKYVIVDAGGQIVRWEQLRWNRKLKAADTVPSAGVVIKDGSFSSQGKLTASHSTDWTDWNPASGYGEVKTPSGRQPSQVDLVGYDDMLYLSGRLDPVDDLPDDAELEAALAEEERKAAELGRDLQRMAIKLEEDERRIQALAAAVLRKESEREKKRLQGMAKKAYVGLPRDDLGRRVEHRGEASDVQRGNKSQAEDPGGVNAKLRALEVARQERRVKEEEERKGKARTEEELKEQREDEEIEMMSREIQAVKDDVAEALRMADVAGELSPRKRVFDQAREAIAEERRVQEEEQHQGSAEGDGDYREGLPLPRAGSAGGWGEDVLEAEKRAARGLKSAAGGALGGVGGGTSPRAAAVGGAPGGACREGEARHSRPWAARGRHGSVVGASWGKAVCCFQSFED